MLKTVSNAVAMPDVKVVIFDFDGTIADSFDVVLGITNRLASEFGFPPARPEDVKLLKNMTSREILKRSGVSLLKLPFLLRRLRVELNREICRLEPIPGIKDVLQELKDRGNLLGIVTSNSRENVIAFLDAQEMRNLFDFVNSGLTLFGKGRIIQSILKQQKLDPAIVIYVGDETRDVESARKIGIQVIAVSWGYNSSQILAKQHPDFLIDQPPELLDVVANS